MGLGSEIQMMRRALLNADNPDPEKRWGISQQVKDAIVNRLAQIAIDPNTPTRDAVQASKALMAAEAQNQSDEFFESQQAGNRFLEIVAAVRANGGNRIVAGESTTTGLATTQQQEGHSEHSDTDGRTTETSRGDGGQTGGNAGSVDTGA